MGMNNSVVMNTPNKVVTQYPVETAMLNVYTRAYSDQVVDKSVGINYFTLEPLVFHSFTIDVGEYSIATQTKPIPKIASIDDSSTYLTEEVYSDSSKRKKIKAYTQTWSLKKESNSTAWLCIESSENLLLSYDPDGTSTECYKINAKGDILDSNVTINGDESIFFNSMNRPGIVGDSIF